MSGACDSRNAEFGVKAVRASDHAGRTAPDHSRGRERLPIALSAQGRFLGTPKRPTFRSGASPSSFGPASRALPLLSLYEADAKISCRFTVSLAISISLAISRALRLCGSARLAEHEQESFSPQGISDHAAYTAKRTSDEDLRASCGSWPHRRTSKSNWRAEAA